MKIRKIITHVLMAAMFITTVPVSVGAASDDTGKFNFVLQPKEYDYSKQVVNTLGTKKVGESATVIVNSYSIPSNCIFNVRIVKHTTDDSSNDVLYSTAVTITQADTYNPVYSKEVTNNIGYKFKNIN